MQRISVDEVMDAVHRILDGSTLRRSDDGTDVNFFYDQHAHPLGYMVRGSVPEVDYSGSAAQGTMSRPGEEVPGDVDGKSKDVSASALAAKQ